MEITIEDYFDAMRGHASPRVVAAVVAEIEKDDSPLRAWLLEVEVWAKASLPRVKRWDAPPLLPEGGNGEDVRSQSRFGIRNTIRERVAVSPIVEDFVQYQRGKATKDAIARVEAALSDPESELSQTLKDVCVSESPRVHE